MLGVQNDFRPDTNAHPAFVVDDLQTLTTRLQDAGCPSKMTSLLKASIELMFTTPSATGLN
jgi:hypothetical protein